MFDYDPYDDNIKYTWESLVRLMQLDFYEEPEFEEKEALVKQHGHLLFWEDPHSLYGISRANFL